MLLTLLYVLFIVVGLRFFEPYVVGMALFTLAAPWTLYELIKNRFKNILVPLAAWGAWVVFGWSLRRHRLFPLALAGAALGAGVPDAGAERSRPSPSADTASPASARGPASS